MGCFGDVGKAVGGFLGFGVGEEVGEDITAAAQTQAGYEREALEYLKEREAIPQQFREAALMGLGGLYGLEGGVGTQQEMIERAMASPLYQSIIGGREAGEKAILRSAGATGGLRSGGVQESLYDYNTQLQNRALLEAYQQQVQGLGGLAQLPSMAPQIAQQTAGIGQTLSQGQIASAQAEQAGTQQFMGNIMGLGQLGIAAYGAGMFSDRRLKKNIVKVGEIKGFNWYTWDWNIVANKMGLDGTCTGVMADEVYDTHPEAVSLKDLFMFVDYSKIGILGKGDCHA